MRDAEVGVLKLGRVSHSIRTVMPVDAACHTRYGQTERAALSCRTLGFVLVEVHVACVDQGTKPTSRPGHGLAPRAAFSSGWGDISNAEGCYIQ
jgi:hypothetical protein